MFDPIENYDIISIKTRSLDLYLIICFKKIPIYIYVFLNLKKIFFLGSKRSKERVTVVLCCNFTGRSKLKLIIIGKSENPRSFNGFDHKKFCLYKSNQRGWMTRQLMIEFLVTFDQEMMKQKGNVALIMDNCPSHKSNSIFFVSK